MVPAQSGGNLWDGHEGPPERTGLNPLPQTGGVRPHSQRKSATALELLVLVLTYLSISHVHSGFVVPLDT